MTSPVESGDELARTLGEQTLEAFGQSLGRWRENGALEIDILEQTPEKLSFNVTRCRYAEMYRALGLADLGGSLSCQRDYALAEGFEPEDPTRTDANDHGRGVSLRFPVSPGRIRWIGNRRDFDRASLGAEFDRGSITER